MPNFDFLPLPEREQSILLTAVKDIMHNGGRIPQDVSNELIMAAILELKGCVSANSNLSRKNAIGLRWLGAGLVLLAGIIMAHDDALFGLVGAVTKLFGL